MTIDERIEALTMNLELLSRDLESFRETSRETMALVGPALFMALVVGRVGSSSWQMAESSRAMVPPAALPCSPTSLPMLHMTMEG